MLPEGFEIDFVFIIYETQTEEQARGQSRRHGCREMRAADTTFRKQEACSEYNHGRNENRRRENQVEKVELFVCRADRRGNENDRKANRAANVTARAEFYRGIIARPQQKVAKREKQCRSENRGERIAV